MIQLDLSILNQKGTPMFNSDIFANRPPAGIAGRIFISTDTLTIYRDTGSTWDTIGGGGGGGTISGTIATNQVAFGTSANTIGGTNNLWWDNASTFLGINTNTPNNNLVVNTIVSDGGILIKQNNTTIGEFRRVGTNNYSKLLLINAGVDNIDLNAGGFSYIRQNNFAIGTATDGGQKLQVSGGDVNFSGSTGFTWDNTTRRLGIGTNTPTQRLDVNGSVNILGTNGTNSLVIKPDPLVGASSNSLVIVNPAGTANVFTINRDGYTSVGGSGVIVRGTTEYGETTISFRNASGGTIIGTITPTNLLVSGSTTLGFVSPLSRAFTFSHGIQALGGTSIINTNLLVGTTTDAGQRLQVTGTTQFNDTRTYTTGAAISFAIVKDITINSAISSGTGLCNYVSTGNTIIQSSRTVPDTTALANIYPYNKYQFSSAGLTLTMQQATPGLRTANQLYVQNVFGGTNNGTITHVAGIHISGFYNEAFSTITPIIPNAFQLVINDTGEFGHPFTFTNRWGIYQVGINDRNYLAGNLLLNSTTDTGQILQVNGAIRVNGQASGTAGGASGQHLIINVDGTQYKIALLNP